MPEQYTQQNSPLTFKALELGDDDLLLTRLSGFEALSELFLYQLELLAPVDKPIDFEKVLGKGASVGVQGIGDPRYFQGIISRLAQGQRDERFLTYSAVLVPHVWLLTKRKQSRIFQHLSIPEILKQVFDGFNVTYRIQGTFHARDYCVQYRESDFDFACRLMEEEGIYYYFRHTADAGEMILANTPQGHDTIPEPSKVVYEEVVGGARETESLVTTWQKVQEVRSGQVTLWDHHFELPDKHLETDQKIQESVAVGQVNHKLSLPVAEHLELYDYPGGYAGRFDGIDRGGGEQPAELQKIFEDNRRTARLRIQEEAAGALTAQGTGTSRQMTAGHKFTLVGHFDADGDYILTRLSHQIGLSGGGYRTGADTLGLDYSNQFFCIPASLPFRPARVTPKPTIKGTQTATVVGPSGEEIFTDKYGRIKVQFPWDRQGKYDADSSCWIRVATIWAGQGWGVIHIPRIGQEVVIDFLEGDPDQPIVIGSVYNADQMPPGSLPKEGMVSGLMSRTTPKGGASNFNGFRANDTKGKEHLNAQAEYDMTTLVKHDDTQTVNNNRTITVKGTHTEGITGDTSISVLKGNFSHDVQTGTAKVHVKGAVTEHFDATQDTTVAADITVTSSKGPITVQAMANTMDLYAQSDVGVQSGASKVVVMAATEIRLITGSSSLVMTSDGTITLSGVTVKVVGTSEASLGVGNQTVSCNTAKVAVAGAEINSAATGVHTVAGALVKIN
jgi:type VI secretion system secreted protein VgrG